MFTNKDQKNKNHNFRFLGQYFRKEISKIERIRTGIDMSKLGKFVSAVGLISIVLNKMINFSTILGN